MEKRHYIILPTYNEKANIDEIIRRIYAVAPYVYVLVIDDSSPDGTANIVRGLMREFPKLSLEVRKVKDGLGKAYIYGFKKVLAIPEAETLMMMDADLSHDPLYIARHHESIKDADVVVGSRYVKGGAIVGWELWRRILSRGGNFYARTVTRLPIKDLTGGFNCIRTSTLRKVDLDAITSSGYAFIFELKYRLWKAGAKLVQFPIIFKNRVGGESKMSSHIISEAILAPWRLVLKK